MGRVGLGSVEVGGMPVVWGYGVVKVIFIKKPRNKDTSLVL
jgi:hypothetical protein